MNEYSFLFFFSVGTARPKKEVIKFCERSGLCFRYKNLNGGVLCSNSAFKFPSVFWIILKWNINSLYHKWCFKMNSC